MLAPSTRAIEGLVVRGRHLLECDGQVVTAAVVAAIPLSPGVELLGRIDGSSPGADTVTLSRSFRSTSDFAQRRALAGLEPPAPIPAIAMTASRSKPPTHTESRSSSVRRR
jgi:hypothetical protein